MAVDILQQPTTPNVTGTNLVYTLSSSNAIKPQFRYVTDIYESGSGDLLTTIKTYTNLSLNTVLDVSRELGDRLEYDYYWKTTNAFPPIDGLPVNAVKTFDLRFGEEYAESVTGSVTLYTGSTSNYLEVFPGIWDINNGGFNFDTGSVVNNGNILSNHPEVTTDTSSEDFLYLDYDNYHTVTCLDKTSTIVQTFYDANDVPFGTINWGTLGKFYTQGVGPQNLIDGGFSVSGVNNTARMNLSGSGVNYNYYLPKHPSYPCSEDYVRFAFINAYGFWDYYNVYNPVRKTTSVKRNQYKRPFVSYDNYIGNFDIENRGETQHYTELSDRYVTTTDYINKEMSNWLQELFESPAVFVQQGNEFIPINITNTNYRVNNSTSRNKLFQYEIEYKMSNNTRIRKSVGLPRYQEPPLEGPVSFTINTTLNSGSTNQDWAVETGLRTFSEIFFTQEVTMTPGTVSVYTGSFDSSLEAPAGFIVANNVGSIGLPWSGSHLGTFEVILNGEVWTPEEVRSNDTIDIAAYPTKLTTGMGILPKIEKFSAGDDLVVNLEWTLINNDVPAPTPTPTNTPIVNTDTPTPTPTPGGPTDTPTPTPTNTPIGPTDTPTPTPTNTPIGPTDTPTPTPTSTETPTPTPADNAFTVERNSDGFSTYAQLAQGYVSQDQVTLSNDGSNCYTIQTTAYVVDPSVFPTITGTCATPTPTPTPSPTPVPASCTQWFGTAGFATDSTACSNAGAGTRRRHNGSGPYPEIGDTIFTEASCTTTLLGQDLWYYVDVDTAAIQVNDFGVVTNKTFC